MKRFTFILIIASIFSLNGFSQSDEFVDDIYFRRSDVNKIQNNKNSTTNNEQKARYKNGAKEIIFAERLKNKAESLDEDSVLVLAEKNDSTENYQEEGYYLNGFKGSQSDLEYAERIRRFHNPKYEIFIADPRYNDI